MEGVARKNQSGGKIMAKPKMLCGVVPATVTPFCADGGVDAGALLRLMRWNMGQGAESFFIGGSSAECFLLAHAERLQVFEAAAELKDEAFLTAHVGAIATREAETFARRAAALGYDAIAATPPFYYGFGSREVYAYYADIAQAAGIPVLIYNLLKSVRLLADGMRSFNVNCLSGLTANREKMRGNLYDSLMLVTALNPHIGYDNAARTAKLAYRENISLKEACVKLGYLTPEQFDAVFHPEEMA
jgi:hypothetical protein